MCRSEGREETEESGELKGIQQGYYAGEGEGLMRQGRQRLAIHLEFELHDNGGL